MSAPEPLDNTVASRRRIPGARALQVLLRSLHIVAMALVLGGIARGAGFESLRTPILWTVFSGLLLLSVDLARRCLVLSQGSGAALFLKLALLGLGNLFPPARLEWYLAATFVASLGSHMSGDWRHFSFLRGRVLDADDQGPKEG
jgi:hypothetical protein